MFDTLETEPKAPENKRELYEKQIQLLKTFLEHGAITQSQFDKSFHDLTEKMGFGPIDHLSHDGVCCDSSGTGS